MTISPASSRFLCIAVLSLLHSTVGPPFVRAADYAPTADYAPAADPAPAAATGYGPARPYSPEAVIDTFIARRTLTDSPGMAVLVSRDGKVVFEKSYGMANAETNLPITSTTIFRIGAVSSQFTAAAILKLEEQGKLKLTDTLDRYFHGFPRGHEVTLHHLLTHTSGIHSYTQDPDFMKQVSQPIEPDALFDRIKKYGPDFTPGLMWSYSSSGYVILGRIVEKVSGRKYEDFLRQTFFKPLGMVNTGVYRNNAPPKNAAAGYAYKGRSYKPAMPWDMSWTAGAASLYSTVEDLYRWNEGLFGGTVLLPEIRAKAFLPVRTAEYDPTKAGNGYGYGLSITHHRGLRMIYHAGGLDGFSSYLLRLPDQNATVVILANALPLQGRLEIEQVGKTIVETFFENELAPLPGEAPTKVLSSQVLDTLVGRYDLGTVVLRIIKEGDRIAYKLGSHMAQALSAKSETEFFGRLADVRLTFVKDETGKVTHLVRDQNGQTQTAPRIEDVFEIKLDPSKLEPVFGEYDYGNGITGTIGLEGERIFGKLTGERRFEIAAESENEFFLVAANGRITFVKDENGRVIKLVHRQNGEVKEAVKKVGVSPDTKE